jgi:hypothetical protein
MATIARELHDGLVTVLDKLNTMAAVLQQIDAKQQNCIHKLGVMAGIQLPAQPPPTPLPALASTNLVQSPLETMDALPTLHSNLQRLGDEQQPMSRDGLPTLHLDLPGIDDEQQPMAMDGLPALHPDLQSIVDEQQPMSMDVLPAFHPDLQQVVDKQQATSAAAQPTVQSELLLPPTLPLSASTGAATATYGPPPRPAPLPAPPTAGTTTCGGIENLPPPSCAPKAAILCTVSIPASSPTLGLVAATSLYKPTLFAWDPGVEGHTPTVPRPQRRVVVHIPQP